MNKQTNRCNKHTEYPIVQPTYVNMSELATMAALKITNSINQHYQQQNQEPLTPIQSHNPTPFSAQSPQSDSSSVTTTNNNLTTTTNTNTQNTNTPTNTNPDNSPDVSSATTSRQASVDAAPPSSNDYDDYAIQDANQTMSSSTSVTASINSNTSNNLANNSIGLSGGDEVDDYKSGSVLEKLSLFEKLEQRQAVAAAALNALTKQQQQNVPASSIDSPSNVRRNDELSKSVQSIDKDPGMYHCLCQSCAIACR